MAEMTAALERLAASILFQIQQTAEQGRAAYERIDELEVENVEAKQAALDAVSKLLDGVAKIHDMADELDADDPEPDPEPDPDPDPEPDPEPEPEPEPDPEPDPESGDDE